MLLRLLSCLILSKYSIDKSWNRGEVNTLTRLLKGTERWLRTRLAIVKK